MPLFLAVGICGLTSMTDIKNLKYNLKNPKKIHTRNLITKQSIKLRPNINENNLTHCLKYSKYKNIYKRRGTYIARVILRQQV